MKTALVVSLVLLVLVVGGTGVAARSGIRMAQNSGMDMLFQNADDYMVENYPWTYGNYAGVRDWYYNP